MESFELLESYYYLRKHGADLEHFLEQTGMQ